MKKKICAACKKEKAVNQFAWERKGKYRGSWCKSCRVAKNMAWRQANPTYRRDYELKWRYGISLEEFKAILESQGGKCAICGTTETGKQDWHMDHNHTTKQIRGVLCPKCNRAIGYLNDSLEVVESAAAYLRKFVCIPTNN